MPTGYMIQIYRKINLSKLQGLGFVKRDELESSKSLKCDGYWELLLKNPDTVVLYNRGELEAYGRNLKTLMTVLRKIGINVMRRRIPVYYIDMQTHEKGYSFVARDYIRSLPIIDDGLVEPKINRKGC